MRNWRLLAGLVLALIGLVFQLPAPESLAAGGTTFYLHGSGGTANPPVLTLDQVAPTSSTAKYKDSAAIAFAGGNPWKPVGTWSATPADSAGTYERVDDIHVWIGLKNSDDQGTRFDLKFELLKNGTPVGETEVYCIQGVTRNPSLAKEIITAIGTFLTATFDGASDVLGWHVSTRIGTDGAGGFCGGHSSAVGLRLYFDATTRASRFTAVPPAVPARIVFASSPDQQQFDIIVMDRDGSNRQPVTLVPTPGVCERFPRWSPNANAVAYGVGPCGNNATEIHIRSSSSWTLEGVIQGSILNSLAWSPDGQKLVFRCGATSLCSVDRPASPVPVIAPPPFFDVSTIGKDGVADIDWSPIDDRLLISVAASSVWELWEIPAPGSSATSTRRVAIGTTSQDFNSFGRYSPTGTATTTDIVFNRWVNNRWRFCTAGIDTSWDPLALQCGDDSIYPGVLNTFASDWGHDGRIYFYREEDFRARDIFSVELDGTGLVQHTCDDAFDANAELGAGVLGALPTGCPTPTKIVFMSNRDGNFEIYSVMGDGGGQARLTIDSSFDGYPTLSPNGRRIAFRHGDPGDVYVMDADGTDVAPLISGGSDESQPSWCGDGRIAFARLGGDWNIWIWNNGVETQLTTGGGHETTPACSNDGTQIAFDRGGELWVMDSAHIGESMLTSNVGAGPNGWSPNDTLIGFLCNVAGNNDVCVISPNGSGFNNLTGYPAQDGSPNWSPDGTKIVFNSDRDGDYDLWTMDPNGGNALPLFNVAGDDGDPDWGP